MCLFHSLSDHFAEFVDVIEHDIVVVVLFVWLVEHGHVALLPRRVTTRVTSGHRRSPAVTGGSPSEGDNLPQVYPAERKNDSVRLSERICIGLDWIVVLGRVDCRGHLRP